MRDILILGLAFAWPGLAACGGSTSSNPSPTGGLTNTGGNATSAGGTASTGGRMNSTGGVGGHGGGLTACLVGQDQTCNDDPSVSSLWGRCEAGACVCSMGSVLNVGTGKCRASTCYSPNIDLDTAYDPGAVGCACDPEVDKETCRNDSRGRTVPLVCENGRWHTGEGTACTLDDLRITLSRSTCFGSCPFYEVTIDTRGTVTYEGRSYVQVKGFASREIGRAAAHWLGNSLEAAGYFGMSVPTTCELGIATDSPSVTTSLTRFGRTHEIVDYHGNACAPAGLRELEDKIDQVAGTAEWVDCAGTCDR